MLSPAEESLYHPPRVAIYNRAILGSDSYLRRGVGGPEVLGSAVVVLGAARHLYCKLVNGSNKFVSKTCECAADENATGETWRKAKKIRQSSRSS